MKKTLLVAALLAGFAGAVEAKTSVTLYGRIDAGIGYSQETDRFDGKDEKGSSSDSTFGAITDQMGSSRWGLKGSEDLGNGLKVIFQLESGFDSVLGTNKSGYIFNRKAILGLEGGFGKLTVGLQGNITGDIISQGLDWSYADAGQAHGALAYRVKDLPTVKYMSNDSNGVVFGIQVGHQGDGHRFDAAVQGSKAHSYTNGSTYLGLGVGFKQNKISLGVSFDLLQSRKRAFIKDNLGQVVGVTPETKVNAKAITIGGGYDFGAVELFLGYGRQWDGFIGKTPLGAPTIDPQYNVNKDPAPVSNMWFAGISAPVGDASKIHFKYWGGNATTDKNAVDVNKKAIDETIVGHGFSLGFEHKLSKRTNVYVQGSYVYLKSDAQYARADSKSEFAVGLRHRF